MMDVLLIIGYSLVLVASMFYVISILLDKKYNFKNYKIYLAYLTTVGVSILNYYFVSSFIKMLIITIVFAIVIKFVFNESLRNCIITSVFYELFIIISESIFGIIISLILDMDSKAIVETQFGNFYANVIIASISVILIRFKFIKRFYNLIKSAVDKLNEKHIIIMCMFVIIIVNIIEATIYYSVPYYYLIIFNTLLIIFCFIVIFYSFKNKNNYIKVYDKYNTTLNSLKEYEDILDRYRVSNHENKNQLLTIRNMIPKSDIKTISYIDKIVENKLKDSDKIMLETSIIPAGGLRGLVYSKVLSMDELNIGYELDFSKEIKTVDLISKIDDSTMLDICQIIGVYIDNAIDEVKELKDKFIVIEMYLENYDLIISISNNYKGKIEVDKLENKGYTTKEKGHGYGLTLTKEIVDNNKKLSNEKRVSKEFFTQILKIKM